VAKVILILAELVFVFVQIGVVMGIIALLTFARGRVLAELAAAGAPAETYPVVIGVMVLVWIMVALSMLFVRQLRAIVRTVNDGDPFRPENAARLARMGWYALGEQACEFVGQPLVAAYGRYAGELGNGIGARMSGGEHVSLAPLGLAMTLFILARVFRQGAAMREDLQGTV
jgi:energy-coupling factor transporter transmembrane protein EcfT